MAGPATTTTTTTTTINDTHQWRKLISHILDLQRAKKPVVPMSFLTSSMALFTANSAEQLMHNGGSPTAEGKECPMESYTTHKVN